MNISNIRILLSNRNEYYGNISIDEEGNFYGFGIERNCDTEIHFMGHCTDDSIYILIISEKGNIPISATKVSSWTKRSIAPSKYYGGHSLDIINDLVSIEITSIHEIQKKLLDEKQNILSLQIRSRK